MKAVYEVVKKTKYFILFLCLISFFCVMGCAQDFLPYLSRVEEDPQDVIPEEQIREDIRQHQEELPEGILYLQVYYVDGKDNYLVPVTVPVPWTQGVARAALEKLIEGPTPAQEMRYGLSSPLPPTTKILGLTIRDGLAKVDLSEDIMSYDPGDERNVLNSIIFTLLQFPSVNEVQIMVEGFPPETFPGGTSGKGTFGWERGLNLEVADEVIEIDKTQPVMLYYCAVLGENRIFYIPVTRVISVDREIIRATLEELLKGPRLESSLFTELPPGTELRDFVLQNNTLIVDFSKEIMNYKGGLSGEKNIIMQVVLTLTRIPGVEKVQLLVEGEKINWIYGTSLDEPLLRPLIINSLT